MVVWVGGYGWIVKLDNGAPRNIRFDDIEVLPETPVLVSIVYPFGTAFKIRVHAAYWCCIESTEYSCSVEFTKAASLDQIQLQRERRSNVTQLVSVGQGLPLFNPGRDLATNTLLTRTAS
jgi:hypothetical protein